jgi:hypothetical protein
MANVKVEYNKADLRQILKSFKAMDDEAVDQSKKLSGELAQYAADQIKAAARRNSKYPNGSIKVADGVRIAKSSKIGEFKYGFASQKLSGGGNTQDILYGLEFGSRRYKQFPGRSPNKGRGNAGYFIYPTLRQEQPELIEKWEKGFEKILDRF